MKYRYKLMTSLLIVLCISFGIGTIVIMNDFFKYSYDEETRRCNDNYMSIQKTIEIAGEASSKAYVDTIRTVLQKINSENKNEYKYIKMSDESGSNIFCNEESFDFKNKDDNDYTVIFSWKEGDTYYYQITGIITLLSDKGIQNKLELSIVYDISQVYVFRSNEIKSYKKLMGIFLILGVLVSFIVSWWLTHPIEKLSKVVEKIAKGDLKSRSKLQRDDEIGKLAADINNMADRIENNMTDLLEAAKKQERFMGNFAHELKTPMTSIIGYSDILRSHSLSEEEIHEAANYIFNEGKRLETLSIKMLELIVLNNEEIMLYVQDPREKIYDVARMLRFYLRKKNVFIKINCPHGKIKMDQDLFKSLISNLCDNAAKAMDNGGLIVISAKNTDTEYIIQIRDNGRGMSEDELEKINEAFYRVDKSRSRAQGGAGLGLAICKKIVEIHDAEIAYKSVPGKGTIVQLKFKACN